MTSQSIITDESTSAPPVYTDNGVLLRAEGITKVFRYSSFRREL